MNSIAKIFFLSSLVVIFMSSCGSDVDPGKIEGPPRSSEAIYQQDRQEVWREKSGVARTTFAAHQYNEGFRRLGSHPRLIEPVEQLLDGQVYMHQYKVNAKAPFDGAVWQWHQDYGTWKRDDEMPDPRAMNISVFLDDVTAANGPLLFIPGSHKHGVVKAGHDL